MSPISEAREQVSLLDFLTLARFHLLEYGFNLHAGHFDGPLSRFSSSGCVVPGRIGVAHPFPSSADMLTNLPWAHVRPIACLCLATLSLSAATVVPLWIDCNMYIIRVFGVSPVSFAVRTADPHGAPQAYIRWEIRSRCACACVLEHDAMVNV